MTKQHTLSNSNGFAAASTVHLFTPHFREAELMDRGMAADVARHMVILCNMEHVSRESLQAAMTGAEVHMLESPPNLEIDQRFHTYTQQMLDLVQTILEQKETGKALVQLVMSGQGEQRLLSGLYGFLKTAHLENPRLRVQWIATEFEDNIDNLVQKLNESKGLAEDRVQYVHGKRMTAGWNEVAVSPEEASIPWKDNGIYLITGGTGGLGLLFANDIVRQVKDPVLILTGRSVLSAQTEVRLRELRSRGARIEYLQADVTRKEQAEHLVLYIVEEFGNLNGIIHSAGVIRDSFILKKNRQEIQQVLDPKVSGLVNLDLASREMPLEFFVFFSSIAGSFGNPGQADYAAANAFMDAYAVHRNDLAASGLRQGRTLSIGWPLWKDGGMGIDPHAEGRMMHSWGMKPLETETGIQAMYQALASGHGQVLIMSGEATKIREKVLSGSAPKQAISETADRSQVDQERLRDRTGQQFKALFGEITQLDATKININEPLEHYGIDSIMINQLNMKMEGLFGELSKTLFYEYQTLGEVIDYLAAEYTEQCVKWTGMGEQEQVKGKPASIPADTRLDDSFPVLVSLRREQKRSTSFPVHKYERNTREPIAIIGLSGRYPGANNLGEYWENLKSGKDSISEIPADRWPMEDFFDPDPHEAVSQGKSYSKWGGFLDGYADFDPLFFNISPREAMMMDPQERLFIESCWEALEDAGYTREQLAVQHNRRVGVFAGITKTGYDLYGPGLWEQGEHVNPYTSFSSVANRVSYYLNLQGPSMPIDTMCSSSLTAIHEACEHLHLGDCEMAIAGGVNLYLHPSNYHWLSVQKMLSKDGKCKSFGQGANGFVPGEGVGTVLLKPLSRAIADKDQIHAVIKSTSTNHGGKTNGYTVPNPVAQGELVRAALDKASVNARTVSYIEAHGTGTDLGDPIEITGLTQAFSKDTADTGFCAIGSAKSNIGHLEAAAGMAGLTKIVLQMKHKMMVPSLHAKELNPNIAFAKTPFVVQQSLEEWRRPVIHLDGEMREFPRIAGVSSFGAGGSNAHVLLEEYIPGEASREDRMMMDGKVIVPLSAKNEFSLKERVRQLLAAIRAEELSDSDLPDIAYTLQIGREAMEERIALVVGSMEELQAKLTCYMEGQEDIDGLCKGQIKPGKEQKEITQVNSNLGIWLQQRDYQNIARFWVQGLSVDWNNLYSAGLKPRRRSLPTYPFAKERYFIADKLAGERFISTPVSFIEPLNSDESVRLHAEEKMEPPNGEVENRRADSGKGRRREISGLNTRQCIAWDLKEQIGTLLQIQQDRLDSEINLADFGFDSISLTHLAASLSKHYGIELTPAVFFGHSTIDKIADYLMSEHQAVVAEFYYEAKASGPIAPAVHTKERPAARPKATSRNVSSEAPEPIAIIGMSGRFPDARNVEEMWTILEEGRNAVKEIPSDRFDWRSYYRDSGKDDRKIDSKWCGCIPGVREFDPLFFEISPKDAELMDPRQRLLLQEAWKALEHAGYGAQKIEAGKIGMFVGAEQGDYQQLVRGEAGITSNHNAILAARLSYFLNLKGPVLTVDTACSSGLAAAHQACLSLRNEECDTAIAAGVNLMLTPEPYIGMSQAGMLSLDGTCFAFDKRANGLVPGEAVAVVVLKRLSRAEADGDHILAVIRGSSMNYDGRTNGITAPSGVAQTDLVKAVYQQSKVTPEDIEYVVTHGTGTRLGDPVEVNALQEAFKSHTDKQGYCAITSNKTNFGHTFAASGLVNMINLIQAFRHEMIPASLNFEEENDFIHWTESPFYVNKTNKPWPSSSTKNRLGAVSAFGMSGTNVHMVLESYAREPIEEPANRPPYHLLTFSAKTNEALEEKIQDMVAMLRNAELSQDEMGQLAYTLLEGRQHFNHRAAIVIRGRQDAEYALSTSADKLRLPGLFSGKVPRDFEGQRMIQQYVKDLLRTTPSLMENPNEYREALHALADLYCQGYEVSGDDLYEGKSVGLTHLAIPTYPFARELYWTSQIDTGVTGAQSRSLRITNRPSKDEHAGASMKQMQEPYEMMTFEEVWEEEVLRDTHNEGIQTLICFLSRHESKQNVSETVTSLGGDTRVIFVSRSTGFAKNSAYDYSIAETDRESYVKVLTSIKEDFKEVDAMLYLWPIEDAVYIKDVSSIVHLVQAISSSKLKPKQLLLAGQYENPLERCYMESWTGFERSLGLVLPNLSVSVVSIEAEAQPRDVFATDLTLKLWAELSSNQATSVLYQNGKRHVRRIRPTVMEHGANMLKKGGTYLITGGCGGLGLLFARHIADRYSANLILTGRTGMNDDKRSRLEELENRGSRVVYVQADICDIEGMREALAPATDRFGPIHGVIHAAGISSNQNILEKKMEDFHKILAPKVEGTLALDEILQEEQAMDFICYFSSTSAVLGDFGSCDYAVGNRFQMAYAQHRNELNRSGRSIVINWPLWKDGGMGFQDKANTELYLKSSGQRFLETEEGLHIFERLLSHDHPQHLVLVGQRSRVHRFLGLAARGAAIEANGQEPKTDQTISAPGKGWRSEMKGFSLEQCLEWDLKEIVSQLLKIPRDKLDLEENLAEFGFDSINLAQFANALTEHYGLDIAPSLFFGQSTLGKLIRYFLDEHKEMAAGFYRESQIADVESPHPADRSGSEQKAFKRARGSAGKVSPRKASPPAVHEPIAIIGMSGRFPEARNIDEMWTILAEGRSAVSEVPVERFDWRKYYGDDEQESGPIHCKWSGTIPGASEFDPMFFEISPNEAKTMDPRQRLLLQESWKALEDAGYGEDKLGAGKIGMFVGVEDGDYHLLVKDQGTITSNHNAILAARLSYFLNLSGPNMAINTACSSGLVAAHQACMSLRNGECDTAIVAGVNLLLTPHAYAGISRAGILSEDGKCYAFDNRANGTVPGEAVAALVFKRLSQAEADGDPIQAVIRGSGVNYDGKTNGITAPSGIAQSNLLQEIYAQYQINPEEIEYVVTHGTGTKLGDPVEINALNEAFKAHTGKQGYCALTSSKTNFGHAFAASGLVSLINLVLSMRHERIPPSLHFEQKNDYIHWDASPFYVNREARAWSSKDGAALTGAVSAFGMSGTNAHMVLESYTRDKGEVSKERPPYHLLALSAKTKEALDEKIRDMVQTLDHETWNEEDLQHISYTLLKGRRHFSHRCAVVIQDLGDAKYVLKLSAGSEKAPNLFKGRVSRDFTGQKAMQLYIQELLTKIRTQHHNKSAFQETLFALADFYCQGYDIEWNLLFGEDQPYKVKLPTYPFEKGEYWVDSAETAVNEAAAAWVEKETGFDYVVEAEEHPTASHIEDLEPEFNEEQAPHQGSVDEEAMVLAASARLRMLLGEVTGISNDKLEDEASFEELGLDSLMITALNRKIELWVGKLDTTLFYTYNSIKALAAYIAQEYKEVVSKLVGTAAAGQALKNLKQVETPKKQASSASNPIARSSNQQVALTERQVDMPTDIAIVGVAGRYPKADTLAQFWNNLYEGKDCIEEIPASRWSLEGFYEPDRTKAVAKGLSYSKWGGFLDRIDHFDPLFFNISPRDAMYMDPQERLFLEVAWGCMENAGYTRESLKHGGYGNQIGVFVGATFNNYQLFMADAAKQANQDMYLATSQMFSIANRVSYIMNFTGPSLTVDTACSSSLYAVHLACESIRNGQSKMAIAGGVNLSLHPSKYITLCQGQFSASDGRCRAFGEGGTGYVPSEAVGAVFLKPLQEAIKDHDYIYGVIKGTAVSHAGRTNGYTVPSPVSQSQAIENALSQSGIDPRSISAIEAHGTGTALGDPIEIKGLTDVFGKHTKATGYCSISSVKSNIGHAEAAAGIAQLTKVLLQLKHQTLVKNVMHGQGLNPNIDFDLTPFVVQRETAYWERPTINGQEVPRRSGISSFGAGGANAHIVVEEYIPENSPKAQIAVHSQSPALILLSAKNEDRLREQARQLLHAISEEQLTDASLPDMAYTLQVGRETMEERLAMIVESMDDLKAKLHQFMEGRDHIKDMFRGQVKRNKETMSLLEADEEIQDAIVRWIRRGKYAKLLNLWVRGLSVDWSQIYGDVKPSRIGLPTYPFAGEPYWIPETEAQAGTSKPSEALAMSVVHPLLHQNTSDLSGLRFTSIYNGNEFFLKDHVVKGSPVLPGVAYLEMARAAVEQTAGEMLKKDRTGIRLKNVVWARPIAVRDKPVQVYIDLYHEDNGEIAYEVYSSEQEAASEAFLHSQGSAVLFSLDDHAALDIKALQAECNRDVISSRPIYETYKAMGIHYGPAHQGIQEVYLGNGQALAKLSLPAVVSETSQSFTLHPSLMDSALQATISMMMSSDPASSAALKAGLPFALQELEVLGRCPSEMWALIRYSEGNKAESKVQKLDIDLCDAQGNVVVKMKGFSTRVLDGEVKSQGVSETPGTLMLEPIWREQPVPRIVSAQGYAKHLVFLCELGLDLQQSLNRQMSQARSITMESSQERMEDRFTNYASRIFEEIQAVLKEKPKDKVLIQVASLSQHDRLLFSGLSGLMKAAQTENSKLVCQFIEIESGSIEMMKWADVFMENSHHPLDQRIRYRDGKRWIAGWGELHADGQEAVAPWKDRGIYLITGGAGGLGIIFAREIMNKTREAVLILTGRSPLHAGMLTELEELGNRGAKVDYRQVDVTDRQQVSALIQSIHDEYGHLNGIIHGAGIIRDNLILRKDVAELQDVMAPKVKGLLNLDEASKHIQLDLFIAFSSVAGATGNPGQADYSAANAFMDAFSEYRNSLTASKQRHGRMLSINWPLWKEGGMRVGEDVEKIMMKSLGTVPMQTSAGIQALYQGLASGRDQVLVMTGMMSRMKPRMLPPATAISPATAITPQPNMTASVKHEDGTLRDSVETALMQNVSKLLKVKLEDIDIQSELSEYGFDSISLTQFANMLNDAYGLELTPTVFFEYTTLDSFAEYLIAEHPAAFAAENPSDVQSDVSEVQTIEVEKEAVTSIRKSRSGWAPKVVHPVLQAQVSQDSQDTPSESEPIAIVGISGQFPMAQDVNEFWKNIVEGKDCITEIPKERWDWRECLDDPSEANGHTSLQWGGFIKGVEEFDPLFFGISPREAEIMDPQQRLLLTQVWKAVEDAGIAPSKLSQDPTGVFVAAGPGDYMNITSISQGNPQAMTGVVPSLIPNRISYALNLQGPSEYYETACSSTLVALHRAIRSIRNQECEQAIVGAVNLLISPIGFIGFDAMGYLSPDGRAKSFQSDADGFVRSEGVGAMIIKPLSKAIKDNNLIYAVIKGTGVAHGGKGMSLTSPNAAGMKAAMSQAFKGSGVHPQTISYIEAHGIASPMADGIEVNALRSGYQEISSYAAPSSTESPRDNVCYISTLKPALGHGEVASGMASLIKAVQAIRHKLIPGVVGFTRPSEHISLEGSPLRISAEHQEWEALTGVYGKTIPRRAAINSYGIGGVNAHVILEEYIPADEESPRDDPSGEPQIIVLSAKKPERLEEYASQMLEYAERHAGCSLKDLAYTLQVGREQMEFRLAFVASSREELILGLKLFLKASQNHSGERASNLVIFTGDATFSSSKTDADAVQALFAANDLANIASQWTKGGKFPWEGLHAGERVHRLSLPVYPFEKRRCWPNLDDVRETETDPYISGRVSEIVSRILGMEPAELNPGLPLDQYGLDSILLMQLLQQLQNQLDPGVDLVKLQECRTLQDIIGIIEWTPEEDRQHIPKPHHESIAPVNWPQFPELILLNKGTQGLPVFWFHGGLGGVEMYQKLALQSGRPFYGIQARGWLTDRPPLKGVGAMAAYYAHIIQSVQPVGPYDLGGYSLGGVLAYEVTRQLQELGHSVNSVVMLDSPYGKEFQQGAVSRTTAVLQAVNLALASRNFEEPDQFIQTLIHRDELDFNVEESKLLEQLIKLGNTRGLTKSEDQIMSMIEANIKIQHAYQFDQFAVMPLADPNAVTCYYFRNKGGLIFGELEPYFSTTEDSSALDQATYWEEWERQFPDLHVMDIDPSNHMVLLSEAKSYETIFAFCEELYSEHGITQEFLRKFKDLTKDLHGSKV